MPGPHAAKPKVRRAPGSGPVIPKRKMGPQRTVGERLTDKQEIVRLMRKGWSQSAIAERLGISQPTVSLEWRRMVQEMRQEMMEDIKDLVTWRLMQYEECKREAWEGWEQSKEDAQKIVEEERAYAEAGDEGGPVKRITTTEAQTGDPRFLKVILECLAAERDLLALDPPKTARLNVNGQVSWDVLLGAIPLDGPVPDAVEDAIARAIGVPTPERREIVETRPESTLPTPRLP